jgi:hypothetical protein
MLHKNPRYCASDTRRDCGSRNHQGQHCLYAADRRLLGVNAIPTLVRTSIVAKVERSTAGERKVATKRTDDGLPVHSLRSLIADSCHGHA